MRMNMKVFFLLGAVFILPVQPVSAEETKAKQHHSITNTGDCLARHQDGKAPRRHAGYLPKAYARCLEQSRQTLREPSADEKVGGEKNADSADQIAPRQPHNYYRIINKDESDK